jgi:predicted O-methyltransferase YrrM
MDLRTLLYRAKSWAKFHLTAWNTGGEGIHSPYLFEWVRMVMSDKHGYYIWKDIERYRECLQRDERVVEFVDYGSGAAVQDGSMRADGSAVRSRRVCDIANSSLARKKYAQMLYRLVNWLGMQLRKESGLQIVELGTSLGITTAYLAAVDSRDRVITYEGCAAVSAVAKEIWGGLGLTNIECRAGALDVELLGRDLDSVDIVFIDANHTYAGTREYFNVLAKKVHDKSVIVVDDIHYSPEMERAWREICSDSRVTSTMDLYQMGLVFFDPHYWRRNYTMRL